MSAQGIVWRNTKCIVWEIVLFAEAKWVWANIVLVGQIEYPC